MECQGPRCLLPVAQVALCTIFVTTWQLLRRSKKASCPSVPGSWLFGTGEPGFRTKKEGVLWMTGQCLSWNEIDSNKLEKVGE